MPKKSIAEKSVYWLKVISLGLILGLGIQFARAWISPDPNQPAPGGNVSGPITTSSMGQLKQGNLALNVDGIYSNALLIPNGNVGIGTVTPVVKLDVAGAVNAMSGQISGVLSSGKVQIVDVVVENTACTSNGLVAKDSNGILLSCQGPGALKWKKASGSTGASCAYTGRVYQNGEVVFVDTCAGAGVYGVVMAKCVNGTVEFSGTQCPTLGGL